MKNIHGEIKSGEVNAIMGPTGSGKTSLLNFMACRVDDNKKLCLQGNFYHNGSLRDEKNFKKKMAFVMQQDILFAFLTVQETLMYAANFYLPSEYTYEKKFETVKRIIEQLGLLKVKDTIIGNPR